MAIRKILYVVAILIVLLGLSQLVFTNWWLERVPDLIRSSRLYLWGLPGLILGVLVLVGVLEKALGLRLLLGIWAILVIGCSCLLLIQPESVRNWLYTIFMDRPHWWQMSFTWVSGLVRILLGVIILYALMRPLRRALPAAGEPGPQPPPSYPMEQ